MKSNFNIKKKIVENGNSRIFKEWCMVLPTLTKEEFLENLRWVCDDPTTDGKRTGKVTRDIGLTPNGIVHINRSIDVWYTVLYRADTHELWNGCYFHVPCEKPFVKDPEDWRRRGYINTDGTVSIKFNLRLNLIDRI